MVYDENENLDLYEEDTEEGEETLEELDVDENGHVIEGRRRRRSREDEYEPDFDEQKREPEPKRHNDKYDESEEYDD